MQLRISLIFFVLFCSKWLPAQSIVDPCFSSITTIGKYSHSDDLANVCGCSIHDEASDLIEWDGTKWLGALTDDIKRPPPAGCNVRAIWMGYDLWTWGGEGFALRLDKPLEVGKTYTFTFTYAKDGNGELNEADADEFSPMFYTARYYPSYDFAYWVGRLPGTVDWKTGSITFTAEEIQKGHDWIMFRTLDSSGTIMSNCNIEEPISQITLPRDTTLCLGDTAVLRAPANERYKYSWSTGESSPSIAVHTPGQYSVDITNSNCHSSASVYLDFNDCEVRFEMPNIFTPNGDEYNQKFVPKEFNYIDTGTLSIYNRWGEKLFFGDLLDGWDGKYNSSLVPSGVYFYTARYSDKYGAHYEKQGSVTIAR